jgi:hypothetical protein
MVWQVAAPSASDLMKKWKEATVFFMTWAWRSQLLLPYSVDQKLIAMSSPQRENN